VALSGVGSYVLPNRLLLIALVLAVPVALLIQGSFVINLVKTYYRRRGWHVRAL
jgi:hypothetical protein